jgi:hypothetical protein
MIRCSAAILLIGMGVAAWAGDPPDDRQLIERAPAQRAPTAAKPAPETTPARPDASDDGLAQDERAACAEANVALAKLELVRARQALRAGALAESARRAQSVTMLLRQIPPDVDVTELELQAEGILARAARAGVPLGATAPAVPERFARQRRVQESVKADEVRALTDADEARRIPDGVISYPPDWPQIVEKRKKWADGVIARSPSWYDKDGREWYAAVYDIHDLTYVPPDFVDERVMAGSWTLLRDALDRQALRDHSLIFRGTAADLAAGIPLLRYFGGVNPWLARGPKYSPQREREVIELIRAFTGVQANEVPVLPPAAP